MSTAIETHAARTVRTEASRRGWGMLVAPLSGLGLVAGLIALFVTPAGADTGETPAEVVAYAASHEGWVVAVLLFALASVVLSGTFVAGLHARVRGIATEMESALVLTGGVAFTLCFALTWFVWAAPIADVPSEPERALAHAEAYLAIDDIGWFMLGAAGVGAALMAVPASFAAMRAGLPAWLGWLGVAMGIASLTTVAFFGMFAWMAWITVAAILLLASRP